MESWADELIRRLAVLEEGGGVSLPITEADVTGLVADLAAKVPTTRTLTGTSPIRIDGGASGTLAADRTISVLDNSTANRGTVVAAPNDVTQFYRGDATWAGLSSTGWFGTGSDGDVTISSPTTLTRDMHYNNLTVDSTLSGGGFRIFVKGTLTNNNLVARNGNAGGNSTNDGAGAAAAATLGGLVPAGKNGGVGGVAGAAAGTTGTTSPEAFFGMTAGTTAANANGAQGSGGGGGNNSGGSGGGVTSVVTLASANVGSMNNLFQAVMFRTLTLGAGADHLRAENHGQRDLRGEGRQWRQRGSNVDRRHRPWRWRRRRLGWCVRLRNWRGRVPDGSPDRRYRRLSGQRWRQRRWQRGRGLPVQL